MPTTRSGRRTGPGRKSDQPHDDGHDENNADESNADEFDDAADDEFDDDAEDVTGEDDEADDGSEPAEDLPAHEAARAGLRYVADLTGKTPTGVTSLERGTDGWLVGVEVIEDRRVPSSADILAIYQTEVGMDGELLGYQRTRRYPRGRSDSDSGGR
jgi:hypothetical protein